jgi:hypothetical protein
VHKRRARGAACRSDPTGKLGSSTVDHDQSILVAASKVAEAFGVSALLTRVDFDSPEAWEESLLEFRPDIVFALNVLNWLDDKKRFLQFLGQFQELIFEGHDSFRVEQERLQAVGYSKVRLVGITERARPLIHCQKTFTRDQGN